MGSFSIKPKKQAITAATKSKRDLSGNYLFSFFIASVNDIISEFWRGIEIEEQATSKEVHTEVYKDMLFYTVLAGKAWISPIYNINGFISVLLIITLFILLLIYYKLENYFLCHFFLRAFNHPMAMPMSNF